MSIDTLTGDEFAQLTRAEHEQALDLYDQAISNALGTARTLETDYDGFAEDRDRLGRLLTLRKVHQVRVDELDEQPTRPRLASEQYRQNEVSDLAA